MKKFNNHLSAPLEVRIEVTNKCNLKCLHCYNSSGQANNNELSTNELLYVIKQLSEMKVFQIELEGGEPFIRKDLFDIVKAAKDNFKVSITTNATLINNLTNKEFLKMFDSIQVSIDGACQKTNDKIRGCKGAFDQAINGLKIINELNIPTFMNMVLTKLNVHEIKAYVELARKIKIKLVSFSNLGSFGRAKGNLNSLKLTLPEYKLALKTVQEISASTSDIEIIQPLYSFCFLFSEYKNIMEKEKQQRVSVENNECVERLTIKPNGDIISCSCFPDFILGNIRKDKIKNIWNNSPFLNKLRQIKVKGKCTKCDFFTICRGGCRARAYYEKNDITAPDPLCWNFEQN